MLYEVITIKDMIDITSRTKDVTLAPSYDNFVGFLADGRPIFEYQNFFETSLFIKVHRLFLCI